MNETEDKSPDFGPSESAAARWVFLAGAAVVVLALVAVILLRPDPSGGPPPKDIAGDPLLVQGRTLYLSRCISCHGQNGRGDGPIAGMVGPTKPGDLTDDRWVHGDRPEQVLHVIAQGVPGTSMAGWAGTYDPAELRALAAYVYHLAGRDVPDAIREPAPEP